MNRRYRAAAAALAAALLAGGCGIARDERARAIDPPRGPFRALTSPQPAVVDSGALSERLYLVKDGLLVAVARRVRAEPTLDTLLRDLLAGPTEAERDEGVTSALLGTEVVAELTIADGIATLELPSAVDDPGRNDEVLAFAQLVCTLNGRPEIHGVAFSRGGQLLGVPRGDGSLSTGPLTATDYRSLLAVP